MNSTDTTSIPLLDEIKIQTDIILAILKPLRFALGKQKADDIVFSALRSYIRDHYLEIGKRKTGNPLEKWTQVWDEIRPRIGNNVERNFIKNDNTGRIYNVTRCKFAEYFKSLNESELGNILMCDFDYYIAEIGKPVIDLTRKQTIMDGAEHCDFCYKFSTNM